MTEWTESSSTVRSSLVRSPGRLVLAAAGVVCVGLAILGVFVPGLPTTVFLIAASYLFARSCPWLERKLLALPLFRPYLQYVNGDQPMPRRARIAALFMMWAAVATSLAVLSMRQVLGTGWAVALIAAASVGSVVILRYRRAVRAPRSCDDAPHPDPRCSTRT